MLRAALFRSFIWPLVGIACPALLLGGCSTLGVRIDPRSEAAQKRQTRLLLSALSDASPARELLRNAQAPGLSPEARLSGLLDSARAALPGALRGDGEEGAIYNAAVAQIVTFLQARQFADPTASDPHETRRLKITRAGAGALDPAQAESLALAAGVRVSGLHSRTVQDGLGVPCVLSYARDSTFLAGQPGIPPTGISIPATAVLTFDGTTAHLRFQDTLRDDHLTIRGHRVRLAADFSAPIAVLVSRNRNRSIDVGAFLFTRRMFGSAGLFQFQPYDPDGIPVVFVHGLLSRPEAWTRALNGLMADPAIRDRYQFWFLLYPTGLPVWKSAALLRSELDRFQNVLEKDAPNPNLRRIVLIGHSMGGVISSLVIRHGGDKLWNQFFDTQVERLHLSPRARATVERLVYFPSRTDISRVIFVATPHRGSGLAANPVAGFFARLVQLPRLLDPNDRAALASAADAGVRHLIALPVNSIRFLQPNSPLIKSIQNLPLARDIPYHSIIGDRGRGDSPHSSDGVVPYWSSHLASAASEKIVPTGHGANEDPAAIAEMRRILVEAKPR